MFKQNVKNYLNQLIDAGVIKVYGDKSDILQSIDMITKVIALFHSLRTHHKTKPTNSIEEMFELVKIYNKKAYKKDRVKKINAVKKYREGNPEKSKAQTSAASKRYYQKNKAIIIAKVLKRYHANKKK